MSSFENAMGHSDIKIVVTKFTSLNSRSIWTKVEGLDASPTRESRKRVCIKLSEFDKDSESIPPQTVTESGEGIVEVPPIITTEAASVQPDTGKGEGTAEVSPNNVVEEVKEVAKQVDKDQVVIDKVLVEPPIVEKNTSAEPITNGVWQQREAELLKKIQDLESVRSEASADGLKLELKLKDEEIEILQARVKNLETELHAALNKPGGKNQDIIDNIKQQHEELLSKARGMIFDKTKVVKNQELQIEALNTQVQSLKDINTITKDLLEIRNSEVKAMEERLAAMEARFKAERERHELLLKRADATNSLNADLKKEYETQLGLFKELRVKYDERLQVLLTENNRLKESMKAQPS